MELWIFIAAIYLIYLLFFKKKKQKSGNSNSYKAEKEYPSTWNTDNKNSGNNVVNDDSDDDALATFTLTTGRTVEYRISAAPRQASSKKSGVLAQWILPGNEISVGGLVIAGGFLYFGQRMKPQGQSLSGNYNDGSEASLIDATLKTQHVSYDYEDGSLGYWPQYCSLTPESRGAYLSWLASDRCDASCPVGYVFIYLYGLERRALVDSRDENISDAEFCSLFSEVERLRSVFFENRSFRHYSSQLLEAMSILRPETELHTASGNESGLSNGMMFKLSLAQAVEAGIPVSADLALTWVTHHAEYTIRTPARRCAREFAMLFKRRYTLKFGDGMVVKPNKTRLRLDYAPASPSLRNVRLPVADLPDPSSLKGPIQKIVTLAEVCTEDLDAYSRYLGRKDTSENDTAAIMLLPAEIINESAGKALSAFRNWADGVIAGQAGLTSVADFWEHMGAGIPAKLNKKEIDLMQAFAAKMGYRMAPDPFYHHVKSEVGGVLVLYAAGDGHRISPTPAFTSAVMMLRLGAIVAMIDNNIEQSERTVLENAIDHNPDFNEDERRSLHAYLSWQLHTPANMTGMKNRLALLNPAEKAAVGQFIVSVACSDGRIEAAEIKQLEKIYSGLGLDPSTLSGIIHQHSTNEQPSAQVFTHKTPVPQEFTLDARVLARHESATDDVRKLLSTIFTEDELEPREGAPPPEPQTAGLDLAHSQLYEKLREKEQWSRKEATDLCGQFGLMLGGALEVINDWSFAMVDAPVLDDAEDDIWVDLEIAEELEEV
ncbi:tellurite resistance TerB family protein [Pantoea sp. USHLN256]|uniref:tellurite resistance TerB family protein n=1 Tax=Pantoea sp. USHLN256 TaxID=3081293 RepID=UPI00301AEA4E